MCACHKDFIDDILWEQWQRVRHKFPRLMMMMMAAVIKTGDWITWLTKAIVVKMIMMEILLNGCVHCAKIQIRWQKFLWNGDTCSRPPISDFFLWLILVNFRTNLTKQHKSTLVQHSQLKFKFTFLISYWNQLIRPQKRPCLTEPEDASTIGGEIQGLASQRWWWLLTIWRYNHCDDNDARYDSGVFNAKIE